MEAKGLKITCALAIVIAILVATAAAIIIISVRLRDAQSRQSYIYNVSILRGECTRDFVVGKEYRAQSARIKRLLASGEIDQWRDLAFRSRKQNEGRYGPHPNKQLNQDGARIELVDVFLYGNKIMEMRMPVILDPPPVLSISGPKYRYTSCLYLLHNDFIDYL
jgi:hypothetical protein